MKYILLNWEKMLFLLSIFLAHGIYSINEIEIASSRVSKINNKIIKNKDKNIKNS
jgi:hypothetical protein